MGSVQSNWEHAQQERNAIRQRTLTIVLVCVFAAVVVVMICFFYFYCQRNKLTKKQQDYRERKKAQHVAAMADKIELELQLEAEQEADAAEASVSAAKFQQQHAPQQSFAYPAPQLVHLQQQPAAPICMAGPPQGYGGAPSFQPQGCVLIDQGSLPPGGYVQTPPQFGMFPPQQQNAPFGAQPTGYQQFM